MTVINYTEARNNFKTLLDNVVNDADYTIISRRDAEDAVVMSLDYFNAMMDTLYLLKSPKNLEHLKKSIAQYQSGKIETHGLLKLGKVISIGKHKIKKRHPSKPKKSS